MKVVSIAFKDLTQQLRNSFAIGMMFAFPLLITGLIFFAFGGLSQTTDGQQAYTLPVVKVQLVNLDQGDLVSGINAGQKLVDVFKDPSLANIFAVTELKDAGAAKAAVDAQQAAVAVLIPAHFSQALLVSHEPVEVALYQDPALSFGPGLVKEIVSQVVDAISGAQIAGETISAEFKAQGATLTPEMAGQVQAEYAKYVQSLQSGEGWALPVSMHQPAAQTTTNNLALMMGPVMAGMLIFAVYFTGANSTISILREQEEGTLARLFTTPTSTSLILGGKFSSTFLLLVVQSVVLFIASALLFNIHWGGMIQLALATLGIVISSAGFGILLISFAKTTRQAGAIVGLGLTLSCMLGGLFTQSFANLPSIFTTINLFVPQGWAMRAMRLALNGAPLSEMLLPVAVMSAMGVVLFALGVRVFRNRFA